jgi:hypothetical protein
MPVTATSIEAHIAIEETGEAQRQRDVIHAYILREYPRTGREAERDTGIQGAWRRLSELKDERKIQHARELRCCTVTERDVTGWIPVGPDGFVYTRTPKWEVMGHMVEMTDGTLYVIEGDTSLQEAAKRYISDGDVADVYALKRQPINEEILIGAAG